MKISAGVLVVAALLLTSPAIALTYSDWLSRSDDFRRGFALGFAGNLITACGNKSDCTVTIAYANCANENKFTDAALAKMFSDYVSRTPQAAGEPMEVNGLRAIREACLKYLPQ
jgi:hypothetical protein